LSLKNKSKKHLRKLVKFYKKDNDNLLEELSKAYTSVGLLQEQVDSLQTPTDPTLDNPREAPAPKFPYRVPISPAPPVYTEARKVWEDTLRDGTGIAQYAGGEFTRIPPCSGYEASDEKAGGTD